MFEKSRCVEERFGEHGGRPRVSYPNSISFFLSSGNHAIGVVVEQDNTFSVANDTIMVHFAEFLKVLFAVMV